MYRLQEVPLAVVLFHALKLYDPKLPYHHGGHALSVLHEARVIMTRCDQAGVPVNTSVVLKAAALHDAGFRQNHLALGFPTKESYSVCLARTLLHQLGDPEPIIDQVGRTIMATHIDAVLGSNEDKVIRAADIANLTWSYEEFVKANRKLKREAEMLGGQLISWADWKLRTVNVLGKFFHQDICLTSAHDDAQGRSVFHVRLQENLSRYVNDLKLSDPA